MAYEQDRITGNAQDFRRPYEERTSGNGGVMAMVLLVVAVGAGAFIYASGNDAALQEGAPAVTAPAAIEPAAPAAAPAVAPDTVPLTPDAELAPPADGGAVAPEAAEPVAPSPAEPAPAN